MTPVFSLLIVGDEILSGKRADKHLPKVIEILSARGLALSHAEYVGDDPDRITAALKRAFQAASEQGSIVFSTGGIGATPDDHTRQCAAAALGRPLALHPQAGALIRERMQDVAREQGKPYEPDRADNVHRLNMGVFPLGAEIIPNPYNKIPGFSIWKNGTPTQGETPNAARPPEGVRAPSGGSGPREAGERGGTHFFPGFPVMAWPMMEWVLDTHYAHLFQQSASAERSVIVYGQMEATLTPLMEQIERDFAPVKVFSLPSVDHPQHGRHIELGVKLQVGADITAAQHLTDAYAALRQGLAGIGVKTGPELVR